MNNLDRLLPADVRRELADPAAPGGRHAQMVRLACRLTKCGLASEAIHAQLRSMYDGTIPDGEIAGVISWASGRPPSVHLPRSNPQRRATQEAPAKPVDVVANIKNFLGGFSAGETELWNASPCKPLEDWRYDSMQFLACMYDQCELINIVTDYTSLVENGLQKAKPSGKGSVWERDRWLRVIRDRGTPHSKGGGWVRMNPVDGKGVADVNITAFRFALIEFDSVPLDLQLSLLACLPLPINAILTSGGKSVHAWIRINAKNSDAYRVTVRQLLDLLKPYGVDQANKNPSRLSRLPGALREIGAGEDGRQRLLYLAPDRTDSKPIVGRPI